MKRKKIAFLIGICSILLIATVVFLSNSYKNSKTTHADFPYYKDTDSLVGYANTIIYGKVVKEVGTKTINLNFGGDPEEDLYVEYTIFKVEVDDVIKGDLKVDDVIEIKQLGEKNGIREEETYKAGYLEKGQECVYFLSSYKDEYPDMPYSLVNPSQGRITFESDESKVSSKNKLFSNDISKEVIIADLKEMVKKQEDNDSGKED